MSAISITLTPGYQFSPGEPLSYGTLNQLGQPAIQLAGQLGTAQLENQSVTQPILALGAVAAPQCAVGGFTADGNGAAPFATGFLANLYVAQNARPPAGRTKCVATNGASPNANTTVVIGAAEVALLDGNGNYFLATNVSVGAAVTVSGVNGLDTGTVAASTWYYLYVIYSPAAQTVSALLSASPPSSAGMPLGPSTPSSTGPTLPSGYTYAACVGAVYNQASAGWLGFKCVNRRTWTPAQETSTAATLTTSYAALTAAAGIPPIATAAYGNFKCSSTNTAVVAGDALGTGADATLNQVNAAGWSAPIGTAQSVWVKGTGGTIALTVTGWEF